MVLPQGVLRSAVKGPVLVELKNGDSYSGTLAAVDNLMNIRLEDAILTPQSEQKFEKLPECTIRGQFVKFIRFPDDILERMVAQEAAAAGSSAKGRGRGRGKGSGKEGGAPLTMPVPASLVGVIIGRGGETIKRIIADSGAQIDVAREQGDVPDQRNIYISGNTESVDRARAMIATIVREKTASRGGGGGSGSQPLAAMHPPPPHQVLGGPMALPGQRLPPGCGAPPGIDVNQGGGRRGGGKGGRGGGGGRGAQRASHAL
mmetsp:Transcript_13482/g.31710  ORF Transcript_13482/g.31710 Transcript_13482/m.31710 type:complete len:260 (-) Transcript_13482:21-800(-)